MSNSPGKSRTLKPLGPPVEIAPLDVFARLLDPKFYEVMPPGGPTPEVGRRAYRDAVLWAMIANPFDGACWGLGDVIDAAYAPFATAVAAVVDATQAPHATSMRQRPAETTLPLREYLEDALGFRPSMIRLYHRAPDGVRAVLF